MNVNISKRKFLTGTAFSAAAGVVALSSAGIIGLPQNALAAKPEIYTGLFSGYGAAGYDVIAYFTQKKPVKGNSKFETTYKGAKWRFSSEANLKKFKQNPAKYAPQYGGYCAYAVSQGYVAKGDPHAWTVDGGKLYLNYSDQVRARWLNNKVKFIKNANQNWPKVLK